MTETPDQFPFACEWCENSPATHLAVIDYRPEGRQGADRQEQKVCDSCAHQVTVLPPSFVGWWLFLLVPDDCENTAAAETAGTEER